MKKILLSLAALAFAGSFAFADEVTFDFTKNNYNLPPFQTTGDFYVYEGHNTAEIAPITLAFGYKENGPKEGEWRMWTKNNVQEGLRGYIKNTANMTVSAANATIQSVAITCTNGIGTYSIDGGTAVTPTKGTNFTIDIADLSDFSLAFKGSATTAIKTITVTYTVNAGDKKNPEIAFANSQESFELPGSTVALQALTNPYNLPVTYSSSNEEVVKFVDGKFTYVAPGTTTITADFAGNDSYYAKKATYQLTVTKVNTVENIAAFLALEKGETAKFVNPVTVVYLSGKYLFVKDATGSLQLYNAAAAYDLPYEEGQTISGFQAVRDAYNGTPQGAMKDTYSTLPATAEGESVVVAPKVVTASELTDADYNAYVCLKNVTLSTEAATKATTNYYVDNIQLYDRFSLKPFENLDLTKSYDVEGFYVIFNTTPEIFVTSLSENVETGIEGIDAENAQAVYYDLNGRRVLEPAHGIFVKVQGEKISKVIVK